MMGDDTHTLGYATSADIEMTVTMLIQLDQLVQLLESPVFTCNIA